MKNNNNYTDCCPRRCSALKVASDLTNAHEMEMDMEMAMKWVQKGEGWGDNIVQ